MMKLVNKTNRMKTIVLPHQVYCAALERCECLQLPGMKNKVARSLTISAGMTSEALPDEMLQVSQIKNGLKLGELEVVATATKEKKNKSKSTRNTEDAHNANASEGELS